MEAGVLSRETRPCQIPRLLRQPIEFGGAELHISPFPHRKIAGGLDRCDLPRLKDFLAQLPRDARVAFEFRHESWFTGEVFDVLRAANAALCRAESEKLETPNVQTADFTYFRLRKQSYSPNERAELTKQAVALAQKGDVFTYFKHEDTPEGALYAEELLAAGKQAETARANMAT